MKNVLLGLVFLFSFGLGNLALAQDKDPLGGVPDSVIEYLTETARSEIDYEDHLNFDLAVRSSLAKSTRDVRKDDENTQPVVSVFFDQELSGRLNGRKVEIDYGPRVSKWLYKVKKSGNKAVVCLAEERQGLFDILKSVIELVFPAIKDWLLYRPARFYDAVVYVDIDNDDVDVKKLEFRYKWTDGSDSERADLPCNPIQTIKTKDL